MSQQLSVPRIEQMPALPAPYEMRNWKAVALGYDSLVYDFNRQGTYLPLIWWNNNTVNYPGQRSFGLHTVVGTTAPNSTEAINVIPSVIGATLCGADKSAQNGQNWVLMCREYFNRANGENVYLNGPATHSGSDWWYDTMPNIFFYQLAWLYPGTAGFDTQFVSVADRWLQAVRALGGGTTPWSLPSMHYRAIALAGMTPVSGTWEEPEAAGAIGWLLYMAYVKTGERRYREGAEQCMEFLNGLTANPSYELQQGYGTYLAARMNAELNTGYDMPKLVNWCFERAPLRGIDGTGLWGATVGTWGGLDCAGLVGEAYGTNDYAFFMNGCELAGTLVPMVRYDSRFARAIGRWMLNLANASRLFYPKYLPAQNQDSYDWASQYDPGSVIAHEALRQTGAGGASPYGTGDAISGGWGKTTLALYGSSHVGILGGIIDTTEAQGVLRLDALKTDYYRQRAFPTYLVYNPHAAPVTISLPAPASGAADVYDAVSHAFVVKNVTGPLTINVPPDQAVVAVVVPAGGAVTYRGRAMLVDSVVVDFAGAPAGINLPPRLKGLGASPSPVARGSQAVVYATPADPEGDSLVVTWNARSGLLTPSGAQAVWQPPAALGPATISCRVTDAHGAAAEDSLVISVIDSSFFPPRILGIHASPRKLQPGETSALTCSVTTPTRIHLAFNWSAAAGTFSGSDSTTVWTAPSQEGDFWLSCLVANDSGATARDSLNVEVRDFSHYPTGALLAWYPLDGDATDISPHANNGALSNVAAATDRFGSPGRALAFGATGAVMTVPDQPYLNSAGAVTVSFWFQPYAFYDREQYPVSHGSWQHRWKASLSNTRLRWTVRTTVNVADLDSPVPLHTKEWYHACLVYSGKEMEIYLDGELSAFRPWSGTLLPAGTPLTVGQDLPQSFNYGFYGVTDDLRIFDYALQPPAVQELYGITAGVHESTNAGIPEQLELEPNFPNPFNPSTTIRFGLPRSGRAELRITDILGRTVAVLLDGRVEAGRHSLTWDAAGFPSGCYFLTLTAGASRSTLRVLLLK